MFDGLLSPIHSITTTPISYGQQQDHRCLGKKIGKYALSGECLEIYDAMSIPAREFGVTTSLITRHLRNGQDVMFGFRWKMEGPDA